MDGFINILKPPGLTSHDVVEHIRTLVLNKKVGHGGTLDPGAAGVLPILLGKATRFFPYLVDFSKMYRAELFLGLTTDTDDSYGNIVAQKKPFPLTIEEIEKALSLFTGEIQQTPPMFSAIKQKGKKLYEYARRGITVERKSRTVNIFYLKAVEYFAPERIILDIKCSKGTYIRTLCSQIGDALGFGGHMSFLLRKEVGNFTLSQSNTFADLNKLSSAGSIKKILLPLDFPFQNMFGIALEHEHVVKLLNGHPLPFKILLNKNRFSPGEPVDGSIVPVYTTKGKFMGLGRWKADPTDEFILKPERIVNKH